MIDTHAHLTSKEFQYDLDEVITRAKDNKLSFVISQGTSLEISKEVLSLCKKYKGYIYPTVGLHPEEIVDILLNLSNTQKDNWKDAIDKYILELDKLTKDNIFVAVGEIGLDYFMFKVNTKVNNLTDKEKLEIIEGQKYLFKKELEQAVKYNLPVVIHSREYPGVNNLFEKNKSLNDILNIINEIEQGSGKKLKAVFHCWTYQNKEVLKSILDKGYFVSFTNIICYPKNGMLLELAHFVNENYPKQIMLETDAPYLPPAHKRGQRSEPMDVMYVYEKFPLSSNQIDENVKEFFNIS